MQRAVDPGRELALEVRQMAALPRKIVVAEADPPAVLARDSGDGARRFEIERQRAEVVDDHQIGALERGVERPRIDAGFGRIDGEAGDDDVVAIRVALDRARDPSGLETELVQRPRPLARFDRYSVVATEPERDGDRLRRHGADDRAN